MSFICWCYIPCVIGVAVPTPQTKTRQKMDRDVKTHVRAFLFTVGKILRRCMRVALKRARYVIITWIQDGCF